MDFRREVSQYESHGGVLPLSGGLNRRLVSSREGVNMRGRGWVRDILSHFIILSLLGAGLFFLYKKAMSTPGLEDEHWVSTVFLAAFILLGMMVFIFARQLFSRVKLERFHPGNPESLARLNRMSRFRLPARYRELQKRWPYARNDLRQFYLDRGWVPLESRPFDAVLHRRRRIPSFGRPPYVDRVVLFYHPMLNVIIVDQTLKMCERAIRNSFGRAPAPRNVVVFMTDMKNEEEVTSAAAGVVNYLCRLSKSVSLYPILVDFNGGRIFYPLDTTLIQRVHRLSHFLKRIRLTCFIRQQVPGANKSGLPVDTDRE